MTLDDIHIAGPLAALIAPKMDLTGTLAMEDALGLGLLIGSATDALIAIPSIEGRWFWGLGVQGIAILGDLEDSQILIGADLGADGQLGGDGADADTYGSGELGKLFIGGDVESSFIRVGQDPVDGIFDNGDDVLLEGSIDAIKIFGEMSDDSRIVASDLPRWAYVDGRRVDTSADPRFISQLNDDNIAPSVTIEQAAGQADPATDGPIEFTVLFSEPVFGFDAADIDFTGSTVGGTLVASVTGSGASYTVSVSGMSASGTVVATIGAGAATDAAGNASLASTSTDNTVFFQVSNTAPVAVDDEFVTNEDVALEIEALELLANDTDVDG
ncbi:MAG TPA: Ig-like domain-containing protein, partial [Pseudomonadales bacterium]|nr:Ig-like domain-containing protein [Pseudomonadales bacterium]